MTREWQKTGREVILMLEEKDKETDIQESTKRKKKREILKYSFGLADEVKWTFYLQLF